MELSEDDFKIVDLGFTSFQGVDKLIADSRAYVACSRNCEFNKHDALLTIGLLLALVDQYE